MLTIQVLLADDHPSLRAGIRARLEMENDLEVVGEAGSGHAALKLVAALHPNVLVLDMELPDLSGVEVARQLYESADPVRVLIFSAYHDKEYVASLRECGVAGYLTKQEPLTTIVQAVRGVAHGETGWLSREVAAVLMTQSAIRPAPAVVEIMTERQRDVLQRIAEGCSNQQIGEQLFISESTVKKHVSSLFQKLELNTRAEAAAWAWKHGLQNPC